MNKENNKNKAISAGAEILGASIGGAIGLLGGPFGSIGGAVIGVVVTKGLNEITSRYLSKREKFRIDIATNLIITGISEKIENGQIIRNDDFFSETEIERSKAEELFEGLLLKCKDSFEEKKIIYISKIYENAIFNSEFKPDNINQILYFIQQLSFRQLCILSFIGQNENNIFNVRTKDYYEIEAPIGKDLQFILQDFMMLYNNGLIFKNDNDALLDFTIVAPGNMCLTIIGKEYYTLLSLNEVPFSEFNFVEFLK